MKQLLIAAAALCGLFSAGLAAAASDAPISRIVLSTSGLAQFEYRAHVTDNAAVEFPVRLEQVDDILKSLVVFDAKGRLGGVTLPGKQPLDQIFRDLPFNRGQLANSMLLLNAYQGATLTVQDAKGAVTGKIVQVVPEDTVLEQGKTITRHRLNLMTDAGLRQIVLEDAQSIRFADAKVRDEIVRALDSIRENSAAGRRVLTVNLLGAGARDVLLSYVVAAPLWKAAYRLVVPEAGAAKGLLQGWAVIENMTAADWKDVDLSLVSGNPVTFRQALYQSYYVDRPEIPVQVFGLVLPRVDEGVIASARDMEGGMAEAKEEAPHQKSLYRQRALNAPAVMGGMAGNALAMSAEADSAAAEPVASLATIAGGANAAQSAEATTQVLFRFPDRFSLKAGQSLMLPFVSREVPMEQVALYQPETNAQHPLASVEIRNDGESGLPPGVLTLYEESKALKGTSFVGDARLPVLTQGEKRLISYALDTKTKIDRADKTTSTESQVSAARGVLRLALKSRAETAYTIKAPAKESRVVVIEHPRMGDYKLVEPDPKDVEVTDTRYRIKVPVKAGETKVVKVVLENTFWQSYGIDGLPTDQLLAYAQGRGGLSPAARKAFEELAALRQAMDAIDQKIAGLERQRQVIFQDQARVRENLNSLHVKSDVQQKYLDKLNAQEDQIARLDRDKQALQEQRERKLSELKDKIAELSF